jgi:hypothetical protein
MIRNAGGWMKLYSLLIVFLFLAFSPLSGNESYKAFGQNQPTNNSGIAYSKTRVRRTRVLFPHLTRLKDKEVLRKVNQQINTVASEFRCYDGGKNSYFNVRSKVDFADKDIFSIYASAEYDCGGAHPTNDANTSLTFDLRTGKQVEFEALFINYEMNKREILRAIFAKQVERSERFAKTGGKKDGSCEGNADLYSLENLEGYTFAFNFSKQGLKVQPQWPHVLEACAELVTVPYQKLRRFAAPDGLLARVTK